jgi:cyclophilin family peptidyl-prolyl cis-trans isomerase
VPTLIQGIPAQTLAPGGAGVTIDLRQHFAVPGVVGTQFAQFETVLGRFNVELRTDAAPRHAANFLAYVQANAYTNTFIHRAAVLEATGGVSIVQGGGYFYRLPFETVSISKFAPVALEYNLANARGTLAAARTNDINSASSEWYFNTRDNSTILNQSNGGGYSVFGRVMGTGMTVVDAMAAVPRYNASSANPAFTDIPLRNITGSTYNETNLVSISAIRQVSLYPTGGGTSIVTFTVENTAPAVATAAVSGTTLTLTPVGTGSGSVTVRATDTNGNVALSTFPVSVSASAPVFTTQPSSQTIAAGSTVVFNAVASGGGAYQWEYNGAAVAGAVSDTLVLANPTAANAGTYVCVVTNAAGSARSQAATLTVVNVAPLDAGRLVNLSILTAAGSGDKVLTMGAVVGGSSPGALPLVIRAVGPTLGQPPFNVAGVLPDPVMTFFAAGNTTPIDTNDNWGGGATLTAAFAAVGAFALPPASLDSAMARTAPGVTAGGYTVQVTGKGDASGNVIAEMYDASGAARTATTPRLINLSTRAQIDAGADLAVGFVLGGQSARTVLVRGVGPSLAVFGVTGLMADPRLELFNNATGQRITGNDDWAGNPQLAAAATAVGAFALEGALSKDAVLLVTLPPGQYSARISGANGAGGAALVEVYEVP